MMKKLKTLSLALGMVATVAVPLTSHAALSSGFTSILFNPAISNNTDMFSVYSSQTIGKQGWNAGFYIDWAKNPIEVGAPPGTRQAGVVDDTITGNFYGTYGITDWFSVGLDIPIIFWNKVNPVILYGPNGTFQDPTFSTFDSQTNLGDILFQLKFRIRNNADRLVGIALIPFVTLPSGPSSTFAGNGSVTGGVKLVVDFNIVERVKLALNLGFLAHDKVVLRNVVFNDKLLASLGLSIKIVNRLMFIAEGLMEPILDNFFDNEVQVPAEARGGFRVKLTDHLDLNIGGGAGLTIGIGAPDFRAFLGLNYNWVPAPCGACEAPVVEARKITIDQVIHFAFDRAVIRPQSYPILNDVAAIIKQNESNIAKVHVQGHTDSIGSDQYNMALSDRRANAVEEYLVKQGVPASILDSEGFGESKPVATNTTAEGRALNRRVDFVVDSK
jgi:outer membrane protein OmpA-like peptidoglycan-associated protein